MEPEPDSEVGSDYQVDEIDLGAYEQDPWDDVQDFLQQQQQRKGACDAHGFLVAGKPGAGKTHLAGRLAAELGAVHVGLPQILADCVSACVVKSEVDALQAKIDEEKARKPPEPVADKQEGEYEGEGGGDAAAVEGEEPPAGPDAEKIQGWVDEQESLQLRWSTLALPPREFNAAPEFLEAGTLLLAGKAVEGDLLGRLVTARLRAEDVQFRGYVMESLPPPLLPDLLLQPGVPKLDYVLMLELTDVEMRARLSSLQFEPATSHLFSIGDRTPGEHQPLVQKLDADGAPETDAEGLPIMVNEVPKPLEKWVKRPHDLPDGITQRLEEYERLVQSEAWRAVLEQLLPGRLITLDASLSPPRLLASAKQALAFETYPILHPPRVLQGAIHLDPETQAPEPKSLDDLLKIIDDGSGEEKTLCGKRSLSAWGPFCPVALAPQLGLEWREVAAAPGALSAPGKELENSQLAQALQQKRVFTRVECEQFGLSDAAPGSYIKVGDKHFVLDSPGAALLDCSMIVDGVAKPKFAAEYCGKVFLLSSALALQRFCANPLPYVSQAPALPRLRVLVAGPPCAGKSEVAKVIADRYGATHVDVLKALELEMMRESELGKELSDSLGAGQGVKPALMTRLLAKHLDLPEPEMPEPPAPEPPRDPPAEGEEVAEPMPFQLKVWKAQQRVGGDDGEENTEGKETNEWMARGVPAEVVEWGRAPPGQESLRFVIDGLPLDVLVPEEGEPFSPATHALRTAQLVPTLVLILEDSAPEGDESAPASVGRERTEHAKEAGFFYNLGRETELERQTGVQYPFDEARELQSAALAPDAPLCKQLKEAGCEILRLNARMPLAELVEAAAARVDPLVYGKVPAPDEVGKVLGASKVEGFEEPPLLGTAEDGSEVDAHGMHVYGHLKVFCPVTWRRQGKLVPGRKDFVATWRGLIYRCKGEAELSAFCENPSYFAPPPLLAPAHCLNQSVLDVQAQLEQQQFVVAGPASDKGGASVLPPLRLMLVGPLGSGRQRHVASLAAAHGLDVINLQTELPPQPPPPPATATDEEKAAAKTEWLPEDLADMAKALCAKLTSPPLSGACPGPSERERVAGEGSEIDCRERVPGASLEYTR